ncbi:MAG: ATP synthase F1 subunit epsilon [Bacteroidales bacterium]
MKIEILTPQQTLFEGEGERIQLPGADGLFEILKNHAPMVYVLKQGKVRIIDRQNQRQYIEIKGGVVDVKDNVVKVLAD